MIDIPPALKDAIQDAKIVVFVGSGMSEALGLPGWRALVHDMIHKVARVDRDTANEAKRQLEILGLQGALSALESQARVVKDVLTEEFAGGFGDRPLPRHETIWRITGKVVTTNYDRALESTRGAAGITPVVHTDTHELGKLQGQDRFLFKLHGCATRVDSCIVFPSQYRKLYRTGNPAINELQELIKNMTLLFLGFSLDDPFVQKVFQRVDKMYEGYPHPHFVVTKRPQRFHRHKIQAIEATDYTEIDGWLEELLAVEEGGSGIGLSRSSSVSITKRDNRGPDRSRPQWPVYLRRRCRIIPPGSDDFNRIISGLVLRQVPPQALQDLTRRIQSLDRGFERRMARAVLLERHHKIEEMVDALSEQPEEGDQEAARLLYRAIGLEKAARLNAAMDDLYHVLEIAHDVAVVRAAQFNLQVCREKIAQSKDDFRMADFTFFVDQVGHIRLAADERILDKALCMHLVVCMRRGQPFEYERRMKNSLAYERKTSPAGYAKNLLTYRTYERKRLSDEEADGILASLPNWTPRSAETVATVMRGLPDAERYEERLRAVLCSVREG